MEGRGENLGRLGGTRLAAVQNDGHSYAVVDSHLGNAPDIGHTAQHVGDMGDGDQPRFRPDQGNQGVFIGITTSGNSENILAALLEAARNGMACYLLTGSKENPKYMLFHDILEDSNASVYILKSPLTGTPEIQEDHLRFLHAVAKRVESKIYSNE
jgi:D-sedoheptulose 7-phosphate isomerase